jgi:hypothetical protein
MRRFRQLLTSIIIGLLSFGVFLTVFAATVLPALAIVEDDSAYVTWFVLATCLILGWAAAHFTDRWCRRHWQV